MDSVHTRKTRQEEEGEGDTPCESTTIEYEAQGVMRMRGWEIVRNGAKAKADCEPQTKWLAYRQTPKIRIMSATLGLCSAPLWYVP